MKNYEILKHTADLAIKGYGNNARELYKNIALGLFKVTTLSKKDFQDKSEIIISGEDRESLLVNFLNELIYLSETKKIVFTDIVFDKLGENCLEAIAHHSPLLTKKIDVKGATYHGLKIAHENKKLTATVIFDI